MAQLLLLFILRIGTSDFDDNDDDDDELISVLVVVAAAATEGRPSCMLVLVSALSVPSPVERVSADDRCIDDDVVVTGAPPRRRPSELNDETILRRLISIMIMKTIMMILVNEVQTGVVDSSRTYYEAARNKDTSFPQHSTSEKQQHHAQD